MNYLFICCDQLRQDTLSSYGNGICHTPNLDALAARGTRFSNAYTTAPLCTPARASMFTGMYALTHGMGTNCDMYHALSAELANPALLLHRKLQEKGFSLGYIGKWHVGAHLGPVDYGFEGQNIPGYGNMKAEREFREYLEEHGLSYTIEEPIFLNPDGKTMAAGIWNGPDESTTEHYLTERTIALLDKYGKEGKPFFLTCQYWGPHGPHLPPRSWVGKADRSRIMSPASFSEDLSDKPEFVNRHRKFYRSSPRLWEEGCREVVGLFYDYMMYIDSEIGRLLSHLAESGLADETTVIFTSDHGDMQWCHGGLIDKGFLYQEAVRIPLIFFSPAKRTVPVSSALVSTMDILPTILDMEKIPVSCDGQSLSPVLSGSHGREDFLMEFHGIHFLYSQRAIVTDDGWKLIWSPGDRDELYNLNEDPSEMDNLIENPAFHARREDMIERLKKQVVRYRDPCMDYVYKIFGDWSSPSGQVDPTSGRYNGT